MTFFRKIQFYFLFFCILFLFNAKNKQVKGQFSEEDLIVAGEYGLLHYSPTTIQAYGLDFRYFVSDNISFNSRIVIGKDYFHIPVLTLITIYGLVSGNSCTFDIDDSCMPVLFLLLSEGATYHLKINENFALSAYINPLGFDYIYGLKKETDQDLEKKIYITCAAGMRYNFVYDQWVVSPYIDYRKIYYSDYEGYGFGINVGWKF